MTPDEIDRVAAALYYDTFGHHAKPWTAQWDAQFEGIRDLYRNRARIAITALREPETNRTRTGGQPA